MSLCKRHQCTSATRRVSMGFLSSSYSSDHGEGVLHRQLSRLHMAVLIGFQELSVPSKTPEFVLCQDRESSEFLLFYLSPSFGDTRMAWRETKIGASRLACNAAWPLPLPHPAGFVWPFHWGSKSF